MQQTSKWQKHLPYLYVGTLRVHYLFSENYKNLNKKNSTRAPSWITELAGQLGACVESS